MNAEARASASPNQAVFHSQIFLRQTSAEEMPLDPVGPGTSSRVTIAVMIPGATTDTSTTVGTLTVSSL